MLNASSGKNGFSAQKLGACAMTTKFLDNKICTFKILLSWRFPRKQSFLDDFPLCPQGPPPLKSENFIFIVVSPSLKNRNSKSQSLVVFHRTLKSQRGIALPRLRDRAISPKHLSRPFLAGENQKGTGGRGPNRKCHKLSQIVVTFYDEFYDNLWRFMTFYVNGTKRRKLS